MGRRERRDEVDVARAERSVDPGKDRLAAAVVELLATGAHLAGELSPTRCSWDSFGDASGGIEAGARRGDPGAGSGAFLEGKARDGDRRVRFVFNLRLNPAAAGGRNVAGEIGAAGDRLRRRCTFAANRRPVGDASAHWLAAEVCAGEGSVRNGNGNGRAMLAPRAFLHRL